jgi:UDP-glucose 4-epimerase
MRVLVTGASGFLGLNLVRYLADAGHDVLALARSPKSGEAFARQLRGDTSQVRFWKADVRDRQQAAAAIGDFRPSHLVHAAAVTPTVEMETRDPVGIVETNELSTVHLLSEAAAAGVERFLYISSAAVYTGAESAPIREDSETRERGGLYALSKMASERYCAWATERLGIDTRVARPGPIYGPHERPTASRHNMSQAYRAVQLALDGVPISCNDENTEFDWIHGHDAARALYAILSAPEPSHWIYNVAGEPVTMRRLLDAVRSAVPGVEVQWVDHPDDASLPVPPSSGRPGLDVSRLTGDLGFQFDYTIETGIVDYVDWLRGELPEQSS